MKRRGFSMTELMVVMGIIILLIGLSLPMIMSARKSARLTACLYRMRDLSAAFVTYQSHYGQSLPLAVSVVRSLPTPPYPDGSPEAYYHGNVPSLPTDKGERENYAMMYGNNPPTLPTIKTVLTPYMKTEHNVWKCPMQGDERDAPPNPFFTPGYHPNWTPGYKYLSTLELRPMAVAGGQFKELNRKNLLDHWLVRNVAGLKPTHLKPMAPFDKGVVVMIERSTVYHSKGAADVAELDPSDPAQRGIFRMNALYVDGHVETWSVINHDDILKHIHPPIRQRMFGRDLDADFPQAYVFPLPARLPNAAQ